MNAIRSVTPSISLSQSSKIFAGLFAGFFVFITIKGELPAYAAVLFGSAPTQASTDATSSGGAGYNPAPIDAAIASSGSGSYAPNLSKDSQGNTVVDCQGRGIYNGITGKCDPL